MTRITTLLGTVALALAFGAGTVIAQTPATEPAAKAGKAAKAAPKKGEFKQKTATTAAGKECSTQADAKGLHGKERRKFRNTCKKEMKAKAAPKA